MTIQEHAPYITRLMNYINTNDAICIGDKTDLHRNGEDTTLTLTSNNIDNLMTGLVWLTTHNPNMVLTVPTIMEDTYSYNALKDALVTYDGMFADEVDREHHDKHVTKDEQITFQITLLLLDVLHGNQHDE